MKNYTIKEFRILKNSIHPEIRTFAKEAMTVDDLLYDLQGSISKKVSKETREIIVTIKEV